MSEVTPQQKAWDVQNVQFCTNCNKPTIYNGKCLLCESWLPGERDKKVPVWKMTLHYSATSQAYCIFANKIHADEDMEIMQSEEADVSLEELEMTQGELDELDEFQGW